MKLNTGYAGVYLLGNVSLNKVHCAQIYLYLSCLKQGSDEKNTNG